MEQRFLYKSYFVFCTLMRPAISFLKSKNFQLFVKKIFSLLYPDRGIVPRSGYIPRLVPFSSLLIFQKIPIMLKYNVYLRIQSEVARKQKRAYKMSKTFEMTISRLRFSELSLSDHNYFRPTRARGPRSTTTSHILKRSTYFAIISTYI